MFKCNGFCGVYECNAHHKTCIRNIVETPQNNAQKHLMAYVNQLESLVQRSYNYVTLGEEGDCALIEDLESCVIKNNLHR